jgi:anti-anti-sigma factor
MADDTSGTQGHSKRLLRCFIERSSDTTLVRLGGEMDLAAQPELVECLHSLDGDVVVDLAHVTFLGACGIGAFVSERQQLTGKGGMLMLRAPAPAIRRVLGIAGLADWIVE